VNSVAYVTSFRFGEMIVSHPKQALEEKEKFLRGMEEDRVGGVGY
jgi:hypothetical protein